jgi:tetratricopeptide (TPR) repeat protein
MTTCPTCGHEISEGECRNCPRLRVAETLDAVTYSAAVAAGSTPAVGTPREPWQPGRVLFDEFEVVRELGQGGMGVVYLVTSLRSGQHHAVKRTRCVDPAAREALLAEVQTWKDLPDHRNLTACHFFRTLGDDVVIFAEYVDGGGLDEAIADYPEWDARTRFDLAIQFAVGLEAAHLAGFVHQDVKPGNALLARDGTLKVTDFGLARTQQLLASGSGPSGLTPAFCSPEQAFRDQPITAATDMWSWAVSVMNLFIGRLRWETGIFAPGVLELHRNGKLDDVACTIPERLIEILAVCFRTDPSDRWASSSALCNALSNAWNAEYGEPWSGARLEPAHHSVRRDATKPSTDPRRWLDDEDAEIDQLGDIGQLALYDRAARRVSAGVQSGQYDPEQLGELLLEKARLHHRTYDWPGALDAFGQATRLLRTDDGRAEVRAGEARVFIELRRFDEAERAFLRALELFERAGVDDDRVTEVWIGLAECHWMAKQNDAARESLAHVAASTMDRDDDAGRELLARYLWLKGNVEFMLGHYDEAVARYGESMELYEDLILLDGRVDLRPQLYTTYFNRANGLSFLRRFDDALPVFERAERGMKALLDEHGGRRWAPTRAQSLTNYGLCLRRMGRVEEAWQKLDHAVRMLERIVHLEGRRDLEEHLTTAYLNLALVHGARGDDAEAARLCERVVRIRRRKVEEEGRDDVRGRLAAVLGNRAYYLAQSDQNTEAIEAYDESIAIREALLAEGDASAVRGLARQLLNRAELHEALGLWDATRADAARATEVLADTDNDDMQVESAQMLALAHHRAGDDHAAKRALASAEAVLVRLAEGAAAPAHVAEHQVKGAALRALVGDTDVASARELIVQHEAADSDERAMALRLLLRYAIDDAPDLVRAIADDLERAAPNGEARESVLALEVLATRQLAGALDQPAAGLSERVAEAGRRTGRYWLSELGSRLST